MDERNGKEFSRVTLYGLFDHCRRLEEWLDRRDIPYKSVNVDLLVSEERFKVLKKPCRA
jgi:glutaredoxin